MIASVGNSICVYDSFGGWCIDESFGGGLNPASIIALLGGYINDSFVRKWY